VQLEELPFVPSYRRARATLLKETHSPVSAGDRASLFATASVIISELSKRDSRFAFRLPRNVEPGAVADMCAHHLVVDACIRQEILEELDVAQRVRRMIAELTRQHHALLLES